MNAVLMQAMGPTAWVTGSATPTTGDFLAVLADALTPSVSPDHSSVVAVDVVGDATAEVAPLPAASPMASAPAASSNSATVLSLETARSAAIADTAVDAPIDEAVVAPIDEPCGVVDDSLVAAVEGVGDEVGRLASSADSVDEVHDDPTEPASRDDLAARHPVGAAVGRTPSDVSTPLLPPWNGHRPVDVSADGRPSFGHGSLGRAGAHSVHGPMIRPGWQHGAVGAPALALRGDVAVHAVGQYAAVARPAGPQHVGPVIEQRGAAVAPAAAATATATTTAATTAATATATATTATATAATTATIDAAGRAGQALPMPVLPADALPAPLADAIDAPADGPVANDTGRPVAATRHGEHATAAGDAGVLDRTPSIVPAPAPVADVPPSGAAQVRPAPGGPVGMAAQRTPHPGGLGMIGTDRVDRVRQQTAGRPVQRLTVDLDDARVAVRMRGAHVSVDVLSDPSSTLGQTWAHDVERTLESAMRAQETAPGRVPVERDRLSTAHTSTADQRHDGHRGSGTDRRDGDQSGREQRREVPWWLTEEDE